MRPHFFDDLDAILRLTAEGGDREELDPLPGLDIPLMPLNMTDGTEPPRPAGASDPSGDGDGADAEDQQDTVDDQVVADTEGGAP